MEEWEWKRSIISYYKNSPPHKVLEQSQGPPVDPRTTLWETLISDFIWSQQSIFETCKVGITWFPLLMSTFSGFSKFTKVMSDRVRTNNSILQILTANRNVWFPLLFERKQVFPNILHITMRRSVSIHLLNSLGLVCYVSAKIERGLKQFN